MPQKLTLCGFQWIEKTSQFNEDNDVGYFLVIDVPYLENVHNLHNYLPFLPERMNIEKICYIHKK